MNPSHALPSSFIARAVVVALSFASATCTRWEDAQTLPRPSEPIPCAPARSSESIPFLRLSGNTLVTLTFADVQERVDERCQQCHLQTITGGFQYTDAYSGSDKRPGLAQAVERMVAQMLAGNMPPNDPNPDATHLFALQLQAWIAAGKPQGPFQAPASLGAYGGVGRFPALPGDVAEAMTNLGSCIPDPARVAALAEPSADIDALFAAATTLPQNLADTDMPRFDSAALARAGVFAYVPTYPLWSDDARKLRMVRIPRGKKITYDPATKKFRIPSNTRFYKTFFKKVIEPDGHVGFRAIETRLIVSRPSQNGVDQALFGTYLWDQAGTSATLWEGPYRDGEPFRDEVFTYTDEFRNCQHDAAGNVATDPMTGAPLCDAHQRTYAVPARHRCVQCHQGAEGQDFVLGFTPIQINRRNPGEGGVIEPVGDDEATQVDRLLAYGVIDGIEGAQNLPTLESSAGDRAPRNDYELRAQAYMVGNCSHCHNPSGFPVRDDPRLVDFNLAPGGIMFQFPLEKQAISAHGVNYIDPRYLDLNNAGASWLYRRVATPATTVWSDPSPNSNLHLVVPHMPANTPGMDCRAPDLIGRWIASIPVGVDQNSSPADVAKANADAAARVAAFDARCTPPADVSNWIIEDLTEPKLYTPRRADWNTWSSSEDNIDPLVHPELIHGMPKAYRELSVDETLATLSRTPLPYGYWAWKSSCEFPGDLPPNPGNSADHSYYRRSWMLTSGGQPRRPLGEVYFDTPGTAIFRAVCSNCHGARANGNSGNAKALLALSNGAIRVANLMQGLFGPQDDPGSPPGANLPSFDAPGPNGMSIAPYGAAKYLVWMASGGTSVKFPAGFESLLGSNDQKYGGNMLTKVGYYCSRLLPRSLWVGDLGNDELANGIPPEKRDVWYSFCEAGNQQPIPADDNQTKNFDLDGWIRGAKINGGLMMFFYLRDRASHGEFPPSPDQCEQIYGGAAAK